MDFGAVGGARPGSAGVPHGELLVRLTEAMWDGDPDALTSAGEGLAAAMGAGALVDAVAVSANFHMMTRIADGTGTPIDEGSVAPTEALRAEIGANSYRTRRHNPPR